MPRVLCEAEMVLYLSSSRRFGDLLGSPNSFGQFLLSLSVGMVGSTWAPRSARD